MPTMVTKDYETGTSGAVTIKVGSDTFGNAGGVQGMSTNFTIGLVVTSASSPTGTLNITYKTVGGTSETLLDKYGDAVTFNLASIKSIKVLNVAATEFIFTPSDFANVTDYTVTVSGW